MPPKKNRTKKGKSTPRIFIALLLIAVSIFFFYNEFGTRVDPPKKSRMAGMTEKTEIKFPAIKIPAIKDTATQSPDSKKLPRVAIVMDDMGLSREKAEQVLAIDSPITLAVLPGRPYSAWVADKGHKMGRDIIVHIPMEAIKPLKIGEGGIHSWMNSKEIQKTVASDIAAVPYAKGASNHMGSAITQEKKAMKAIVAELKKHNLFFLDSMTTGKSLAYKTAKAAGVKALKRDVFLDNLDDPEEINKQWDRLLNIAAKKGTAIIQAHPRQNSIEFLKKALKDNTAIEVVPISDLLEP